MTNQKQPKLVVQVEQQNEKAPGEEEVTVAQHKKPQVKVVTSTSNNINNNEENEDNEMPCTPPAQPIISTTQSYSSPVTIMVRAVVPRMERLSWPRFALLSFLVALPTLIYILGFTRLGLGMDCFYYLADRYGDDYASTVGGMTGFWFLLLYVLDADSWHLRFTYGILYQRVCGLLFVLGTTLTVLFMTGDYPYGPICLFAALTPLFLIFTNNVLPERKPTRVYVRSLSGPLFFISVLTGVIWLVWTFLQEENEYNQVTKVVFAQATGCKPNLEEFPECSRAAYEEAIMAYFDPQNETQSQVETDMDLFNSTDNATDNTRFLHTVPNGTHHHNETDEFNHKDDSNLTTTIVQDESQWNPTDVCFDVIQSPPAFLFPVNNQYNYNGTTTTTADKEFCDSDCPRHVYQDCLNAFILWAGPLLVSMVLFFLSFFCTFLHNTKNNNNTEISRGALDPNDADSQQQQQQPSSEENEEQEQQQPKVENNSTTTDMLNFGKLWLFLLFVMWLTASLAGVAAGLTSALLAMTLASFVGSVILAAMTRSKVESKAQAKAFWKSLNEKYGQHLDVARGLFLVTCTPMILIYVVLSVVNQGIRKLGLPCSKPIKTEEARQDFITKRTRRHINAFLSWDRTKVLTYAVYWGVAFMMLQVIVAQFTVLFLSWLIESTSSLNVGTVTAILVGVGMIMFMLPPVPGVPIYLTLGIVILATGRDMFGLSGSMAYAAAISLALKLVACTVQQKLIGENLARYVAVRKLVQINSKLIKAMKLILAQPGMGIDKVCILVGGPDWPTSVLCGIMGLNLIPILVGTLPVILLILPTMLTGSFTFMSGLMNEDESLEFPRASVLATVFAAITAVVQLAAMILAAYYLEQTISQRSEEIDAIEDDKEVAALEAGEVEFNNCYDKVTQWAAVPRLAKATLYLSFVTMVVCCYLVQLFSNACFAEYQLTFTIDEHLDGDWLNFILPLGWVAIFLFLFSCILLGCFITWASMRAKRDVKDTTDIEKTGAADAEEQAQEQES